MNKFRRKAKKSLLGALSLLSAFSSVAPMSAMNSKNGEVGINADYDDDDLSGYDTEAEEEDVPALKKTGLSTTAKVGIVGVTALGFGTIGLLSSYLSKSDGEIGKKIAIEDIDLQNRYNGGAIVGFTVGEKIDSATMKQEFPNSQSKIKDGFNYEYLGGKEFKVIDIYLNNGQSCVYLGADIKNSPTLKNMNESNGNPIDSKAHYKVTRTGDNYTIVKSGAPNLTPPVTSVVPVQAPGQPAMPQLPPVAPVDNLPNLYTSEDVVMLANNSLLGYNLDEMDGIDYLYEMDSINRKIKKSTLNIDIFSTGGFNKNRPCYYGGYVSGKIIINTMNRFPDKCKLYSQNHELDSNLDYELEIKYDRETKGIQIRPLLAAGQVISAFKAHGLGLIKEEPQPNVFFIIDNNHVPQVYDNVAVAGNRLFDDNKVESNLNPGIIYVLNNNQLVAHDINKEYLRSHKDNRFTIEELSHCLSLEECLIPGTSVKFKDLNTLRYPVVSDGVLFGDLDCVITSLDNPSVCLVSSAPLETFTLLFDDSLSKFKIYENPGSPAPLTIQELRSVQNNRRVRQDQTTGRLYLTQMPGVLSREEDRILHPPVQPIPNMIHDSVAVPGVCDAAVGSGSNVLGSNIRNSAYVDDGTVWSINKYLNHLIDNPTASYHLIGVVGNNPVSCNQGGAHSLNSQNFEDVFGPRNLVHGINHGVRYVRRRLIRGINGDNDIYYLYEIVGRASDTNHTPRYGWFVVRIGSRNLMGGPDNIIGEPQFRGEIGAPNLQNILPDTWVIIPH